MVTTQCAASLASGYVRFKQIRVYPGKGGGRVGACELPPGSSATQVAGHGNGEADELDDADDVPAALSGDAPREDDGDGNEGGEDVDKEDAELPERVLQFPRLNISKSAWAPGLPLASPSTHRPLDTDGRLVRLLAIFWRSLGFGSASAGSLSRAFSSHFLRMVEMSASGKPCCFR